MGFGGGGGGALPNHEHTNIALDGGPLDFVNTTIASLSAGSTTFSDGAALQELVVGNASDILTVNAGGTAPEWAAGGGSLYELVGTTTTLVVAPNGFNGLHLTFAAIDMTAVTELIALVSVKRGINSMGILWNSRTAGYDYGGAVTTTAQAGTDFGASNTSMLELGHHAVGTYQAGEFHLQLNEQNNNIYAWGQMGGEGGGNFAGGGNSNSDTTIDSVSWVESGQNMQVGTNRLTVYKVSR